VTHPFHPLSGRDFEFVVHKQNWGENRVWLHDEDGNLFSPTPTKQTAADQQNRRETRYRSNCRAITMRWIWLVPS
jgi:hypothetical protein